MEHPLIRHTTINTLLFFVMLLFFSLAISQTVTQLKETASISMTVNGMDTDLRTTQDESLIFTLDFDPSIFTGREADWWLLHVTPKRNIEYFDTKTLSFKAGTIPSLQEKLFSFKSYSLPLLSYTELGSHWVYFGVDLNKNAIVDLSTALYTGVKVEIEKEVPKPFYNQAYQQNFEKDSIEDIIKFVENSFVLIDSFMPEVAQKIPEIKNNNNIIGCYMSIGTGESWRTDFAQIKPYLVKKQWDEWEGEFFVSQTTTGILPIMKLRIDKMEQQGCDWVEFDNMDWAFDDLNRKKYVFQLTKNEAITYFQALCDYVHQKDMKCMAKNITIGADAFNGVLYESFYNKKNWWDSQGTKRFLAADKLVVINHYNEHDCNKVYLEYKRLYDSSFICEDAEQKIYIHY